MPYNSVTAARYLLAVAYNKGIILNVTEVRKLLYIAYGYFLSRFDKVLLDEKPRTWPYGPVFPRTRKKVPYDRVIKEKDNEFAEISEDTQVKEVFSMILDKYSIFAAPPPNTNPKTTCTYIFKLFHKVSGRAKTDKVVRKNHLLKPLPSVAIYR